MIKANQALDRQDLRSARSRMKHQRHSWTQAFTMVELMVTVVIIGIVMGITITESRNAFNRDRLNEATLLLRGWLGEIQKKPDTLGTSCTVTISTGSINSGAQIASVSPTTCSSTPTLMLPGLNQLTFSVGATQASWNFTPRNAIDATSDVDIKLSLSNFTALRCVKVFAISGVLRFGRNDSTSTVTSSCNAWSAI